MMKLLSIGAGIEQLPFIQKAKSLGYEVHALDLNPDSPGFQASDHYKVIDISDTYVVAQYFEDNKLDGLIPVPLGRMLTTIGYINSKFNLPGISHKASIYCTDKELFQAKLIENKIPQPFQYIVKGREELNDLLKKIPLPVIVKPQFGSGSRGVVTIKDIVQDADYIEEHISSLTPNEDSVVQEFLEGPEFGYDGIMENGKLTTVLIREKSITPFPYRQVIAYISPSALSEEVKNKISQTVESACLALGVDNCLLHADIIVKEDTPFIIELAGRPGGISIANSIIPFVTGMDYIQAGLELCLSQKVQFPILQKNPLILSYFPFEGKVEDMPEDIEKFRAHGLVDYIPLFKKGDILEKVKTAKQIVNRGIFSITGNNAADAQLNYQNFLSEFKIKTTENEN